MNSCYVSEDLRKCTDCSFANELFDDELIVLVLMWNAMKASEPKPLSASHYQMPDQKSTSAMLFQRSQIMSAVNSSDKCRCYSISGLKIFYLAYIVLLLEV